jgi:hypothetical protein
MIAGFRTPARREDKPVGKDLCGTKGSGEEMVLSITDGLLGGFLSGLELQSEMSDLLEQVYYDTLR